MMIVNRIIGRLVLRKSAPRWFSTASENATSSMQPPRRRSFLFNKVIRTSSKSSIADILKKWVDNGNQVKKIDIIDLSYYFRNHKNFHAALQLYDWMDSSELRISDADQAIRIDLLCKTKGLASGEEYFNSLRVSEKTKKTYGALLSCYCRERDADKALEVFEKIKALNLVSTLNYNNVLSLYLGMEQPEKVVSLAQEMEEKNIDFSRYTYNMLINSYAALKKFDAMEVVVKKMESSNMKPDLFTYGNIATIYFNSGLHEKANAFLELMEKMLIQHGEGAFEGCHTLIKLYSMMNNLSGVNRAWEVLKSAFPTPSNTSYLLMLLALSKMENKESLEKIFIEWKEGCTTYDFRIPNVLLEYYLGQNMIAEATSLYKTMEGRADTPNLRALNLFTILCIKNGQTDLALKYLEMGLDAQNSKKNKWFPTDETIKLFINYFEENDDTDRAKKFVQSMKKQERVDSNSLL